MATPVTIVITSNDPSPVLISGVVVDVYDVGSSFVTSGTTDVDGEVEFSLVDADYDLLFFKKGVSILPKQPQRITVDVNATSNTFDVIASIFAPPQSIDPQLCRISGTIRGSGSVPIKGFRLYFGAKRTFSIIDNEVIAPSHIVEPVSNEDGFFEFDLYRGLEYDAFIWDNRTKLNVIVPELPAISLDALLFPIPVDVAFSDTVLALTVGDDPDESVTYIVSYSDGSTRTFSTLFASLATDNDNDDVVEVELLDEGFQITPLAVGVANITMVRTISNSTLFDPEPTFTTDTLQVTVT